MTKKYTAERAARTNTTIITTIKIIFVFEEPLFSESTSVVLPLFVVSPSSLGATGVPEMVESLASVTAPVCTLPIASSVPGAFVTSPTLVSSGAAVDISESGVVVCSVRL